MPSPLTVILPYYNQPVMLARQLSGLQCFPPEVRVIVVDDGSAIPAEPIITKHASHDLRQRLRLYRVKVDIPWNRGMCRNLGASEAETAWIVQTDIDHIMPPTSITPLLDLDPSPHRWYRFPRYRVGKADETRHKDDLPADCTFGPVKPHGDSYLITRELFLSSPCDEDYSGLLGGGTPWQHRMEARAPVELLPEPICLHVYTRHVIPDASVTGLSRDTMPYAKLRKKKEREGKAEPGAILRQPWERVL